ncbi:hypothetical protein TYRP_021187 [Tyrophagus putrescentiae]|nr:hypothetical protein TYRP_021187 [Tyrophagus putrescentiae]
MEGELGERFIRLGDVADVEKGAGVGAEEQRRAEEDHPHENVGEEEEVQAENGLKPQRIGAAVLQCCALTKENHLAGTGLIEDVQRPDELDSVINGERGKVGQATLRKERPVKVELRWCGRVQQTLIKMRRIWPPSPNTLAGHLDQTALVVLHLIVEKAVDGRAGSEDDVVEEGEVKGERQGDAHTLDEEPHGGPRIGGALGHPAQAAAPEGSLLPYRSIGGALGGALCLQRPNGGEVAADGLSLHAVAVGGIEGESLQTLHLLPLGATASLRRVRGAAEALVGLEEAPLPVLEGNLRQALPDEVAHRHVLRVEDAQVGGLVVARPLGGGLFDFQTCGGNSRRGDQLGEEVRIVVVQGTLLA